MPRVIRTHEVPGDPGRPVEALDDGTYTIGVGAQQRAFNFKADDDELETLAVVEDRLAQRAAQSATVDDLRLNVARAFTAKAIEALRLDRQFKEHDRGLAGGAL